MRLSSLLLLTSASLASAQWGDYLSRFLSPQKPLTGAAAEFDPRVVIEKRVRNITSENWRTVINNTAATKGEDAGDVVEEWLWYFTTSASVNGTRNVTVWDGVFEDTAVLLATSKELAGPTPKINLGKIDCASAGSTDLCNTFWLAAPQKLPEFFHIASYANGTVQLREVPWAAANVTDTEVPKYLVKFHQEGLWKGVGPWTGVFNPISGMFKEATPYVGIALGYFERVPQAVVMAVVSFIGMQVMSRINQSGRNMAARVAPRAAPAAGAS